MDDKYWETGKCPKCGEDLTTETYKEYRDTQILLPMYEEITHWYCTYCGWSDGNAQQISGEYINEGDRNLKTTYSNYWLDHNGGYSINCIWNFNSGFYTTCNYYFPICIDKSRTRVKFKEKNEQENQKWH